MISFTVTAKLICVFVFAYAKSRFSHDEAQLSMAHSSSTHHDSVPLTYVSRSSDFVKFYVVKFYVVKFYVVSKKIYVESRNKVHISAAVIAGSMKPCTVIIHDKLFKQAP